MTPFAPSVIAAAPPSPWGEGDVDGDGNEEGEGQNEGEGRGDVDGDCEGEGEGQSEGDGNGEGNGSPTCLTVLGSSGLRSERMLEGTLGGAIGCGSCSFLTSSRFGRDPSGAPAIEPEPFWTRSEGERPPSAFDNGVMETCNSE